MSRAVRGVAGAAGLIAVLTLLARVVGFGRTLVFADSVRAAGVGEVYNAVNAVPNVLYEVVAGGALAAVAVPLVAGYLGRDDVAKAQQVASALLTWAMSLLVPLALVVALAAEPLSALLVGSRVPGGVADGALMLRIFAWQIPLYGLGLVLTAVLQSHRRFGAVALAPLLSSLVVIGAYATYGSLVGGATVGVGEGPLRLLAWGTTAGVAALSLPLLVPALRTGWRPRLTWTFPPGDAARARSLAAGGLVALGAQQAALLTTIWIANHRGGGAGTLSVYGWVQAVYLLPYAVLAVPLATAAFPSLAGAGGVAASAGVLRSTLQRVVLLSALGATVLVAAAPEIGAFFALLDARRGAGSTSGSAVLALAPALAAFAPGLVGFSVSALLVRALYARGRSLTAGAAVATGWVVSAVGAFAQTWSGATPRDALVALGTWSSVGMTVSAILLVVLLRRTDRDDLAAAWPTVVASVVALALAGRPLWSSSAHVGPGEGSLGRVLLGGVSFAVVGALLWVVFVAIGHRPSLRLLWPQRERGSS